MQPTPLQPQNATKPPAPAKGFGISRKLILAGFLVIVVSLIASLATFWLLRKQAPAPTSPVVLSEDELSNIKTSSQTPDRTLTIAGHGIFKGNLTVEKDLSIQGKLKLAGQIEFAQLEVGALTVSGSSTLVGPVTVGGALNVAGNGSFGGTLAAGGINTGTLNVSNLNLGGHLRSGGAAPTITPGPAAGGGGTSISGNDTAGTVTINTGSGGQTGLMATVRFRSKYGAAPRVIITPVGSNSAGLRYYIDRNADIFTIGTISATIANASYTFDYYVVE